MQQSSSAWPDLGNQTCSASTGNQDAQPVCLFRGHGEDMLGNYLKLEWPAGSV